MSALRIANASGFYGDRLSAPREMLEGGPLDVLTGDYLSELTLFILARAREKDPQAGYAATFLVQMEGVLAGALARGVRIVSNAGGLHPIGLADRVRALAVAGGPAPRIAVVDGDDLQGRLGALHEAGEALAHLDHGRPLADAGLPVVAASAYLGGWGIAEALGAGADLVITGRVADAALVSGPAAWRFGWRRDDWDALAGATVAGHILECGTQATGGNFAFFRDVGDLRRPGFPIAEVEADGSAVITKHPGTGGAVTVETVTAQLVYEVAAPLYVAPDVVARFDRVRLEQLGPDRVRVWGVTGAPAPDRAKVSICLAGGWRNAMTLVLGPPDVDAKAALATSTLQARLSGRVDALDVRFVRTGREGAETSEEASSFLVVAGRDRDPKRVGRPFTAAVVEMALASYPGLHAMAPPGDPAAFGVFWPALVPASAVRESVILPDGSRRDVAPPPRCPVEAWREPETAAASPAGPTRRVPLGQVAGARSGDKGTSANVGVWVRTDAAWAWIRAYLTVERFRALLPETAACPIRRYALPNLRALNFVIEGLLGEGAAAPQRLDPQAKNLAEFLRSRAVDVPTDLLG